MIHSTLSEYSLVVHFCPWHCFLSFASRMLYSSAIIYRRDSSTPRSVPPAVCQYSSSCLSPRNSITFLLAGCSSAFTTAHPHCRSRAPSSLIEDFHLVSTTAISTWRYELNGQKWGPLNLFFRLLNLAQHQNPTLLLYKIWLFIHPNSKPYYFYHGSIFDDNEAAQSAQNHTCLNTPTWTQGQSQSHFATETVVCSSVPFDFSLFPFTFPSLPLYLQRKEQFLPSPVGSLQRQGGEGNPSAVGGGGQPSALEMHRKCWLCSRKPGTASQSRSVALTKKDALSKEGILMTSDHPTTTPPWQAVTAKLLLLSLASVSLTLQRFCRLQQSNCIIPANENVMFHCWLPQSLKSILI